MEDIIKSAVNNIILSDHDNQNKIYELCNLVYLKNYDTNIYKLVTEHSGFSDAIKDTLEFYKPSVIKKSSDGRLIQFWKSLCNKGVLIDENVLILKDEVYWMGRKNNGNQIFIRKCYSELYDKIVKNNIDRFVILGNPGIGKTFFGMYIIYRLLNGKKDILYQGRRDDKNYIYFSYYYQTVYEGCYDSIKPLLNDIKNVVYISDSNAPVAFDGMTIVLTSPDVKIFKVFEKDSGEDIRYYMPVWTLEELIEAKSLTIYKNKPYLKENNMIEEMYKKLGGIARYIIDKTPESISEKLEEAIETCDIDRLLTYIGESDVPQDIRHMLVHIGVDKDYNKERIKFASTYIRDRIYEKYELARSDKLGKLFQSASNYVVKGGILGELFENYVHNLLPSGGTFTVKNLSNTPKVKNKEYLKLNRCDSKIFEKIEDINVTNHKGLLSIPKVSNFESVDSFIISTSCDEKLDNRVKRQKRNDPHIMFQITVSTKHSIKQNGLNKLIQKLDEICKKQLDVELYFIVPRQIYDKFKLQQIVTTDGMPVTNVLQTVKRVTQYALLIEI